MSSSGVQTIGVRIPLAELISSTILFTLGYLLQNNGRDECIEPRECDIPPLVRDLLMRCYDQISAGFCHTIADHRGLNVYCWLHFAPVKYRSKKHLTLSGVRLMLQMRLPNETERNTDGLHPTCSAI